jgi:hypothetical protein
VLHVYEAAAGVVVVDEKQKSLELELQILYKMGLCCIAQRSGVVVADWVHGRSR